MNDKITIILSFFASLLTALGGWEMIKYLLNREPNTRKAEAEADKAEAEADNSEFSILKETILFLQSQLKEKEERFADQTDRLRSSQERETDLIQKCNDLKLELFKKRCEKEGCKSRQPQNGY